MNVVKAEVIFCGKDVHVYSLFLKYGESIPDPRSQIRTRGTKYLYFVSISSDLGSSHVFFRFPIVFWNDIFHFSYIRVRFYLLGIESIPE